MREVLQSERLTLNPAGIEWVIVSGAEVGSDLYMVAGPSSATGYSAMYKVDPSTGEARGARPLGVEDPMAIAWDGSMMYLIDNDSDALYTVRQIQAPSTTLRGAESYLPNAGDLYYNGGNFADAFLRWDNPEWKHDDADCDTRTETKDADCSTYEHDLILEWRNDGGWFAIQRRGTRIPGPVGRSFCTTWSDLPMFYDDCPTAGVSPDPGVVELSFGTFKAPLIEPGRDYYGSWRFQHQRGTGSTTTVKLYGQEGEYDSRVVNF